MGYYQKTQIFISIGKGFVGMLECLEKYFFLVSLTIQSHIPSKSLLAYLVIV